MKFGVAVDSTKRFFELEKKPLTVGEEGDLYRFRVRDKGRGRNNSRKILSLWAKKWYRAHEKGYTAPKEAGITLLSPYWAEIVFLEQELAHMVGGNHVIQPLGFYDERVYGDEFDITGAKRPVNISLSAEGNSDIAEKVRKINFRYQEESRKYKEMKRMQGESIEKDGFFMDLKFRHDAEIRRVLGNDVGWGHYHPIASNNIELTDNLALEIEKNYPEHIIPRLVKAGIRPVHPEANFVPAGNRDHHKTRPYGTYIEMAIFDLGRLRKYLSMEYAPEYYSFEIEPKIARLERLRILDNIYDRTFVTAESFISLPAKNLLRFDPVVSTVAYGVLERVGKALENGEIDYELLGNIPVELHSCINTSSGPRDLIQLVRNRIVI